MVILRVLFALVVVAAALTPGHAAEKLITVTGEASIAIAPEVAVIRIGVSSQDKTAREASDANARQMISVLAAIKSNGVAERDIQTSRLSLQAQYDSNKGSPTHLIGFQATNQVTVKVRDIDKLPALLDRAIAAGANEISGIEFVVLEQSKALDRARDDAIADAHRKAELYAKAAGAKLGRVVAITEEALVPSPRPMQALRAGALPIAPGEQTLKVVVTVSYELTP